MTLRSTSRRARHTVASRPARPPGAEPGVRARGRTSAVIGPTSTSGGGGCGRRARARSPRTRRGRRGGGVPRQGRAGSGRGPAPSSTPWKSGVAQATAWTGPGSGKNVPEKRNSGFTTKRKTAEKPTSFFWVAVKAMRHDENPIPVSTTTGIASTARGERAIPNRTRTMKIIVATVSSRKLIQNSSPSRMWRVRAGSTAWPRSSGPT